MVADSQTGYKQLLIVRKDLGMPCGKIAVQLSRASDTILRQYYLTGEKDERIQEWLSDGINKKIALKVNTEDQLLQCIKIAKDNRFLHYATHDIGLTHFHGNITLTAVAIGPALEEELNPFFGTIPIL